MKVQVREDQQVEIVLVFGMYGSKNSWGSYWPKVWEFVCQRWPELVAQHHYPNAWPKNPDHLHDINVLRAIYHWQSDYQGKPRCDYDEVPQYDYPA